jgi:hypothetical protein
MMDQIFEERNYLLNILRQYENKVLKLYDNQYSEQIEIIHKFVDFMKSSPNCFLRSNLYGHITGSAFVVNKSFSKVLFTYHAKLCRWLQLGGHADGESIIQNVALKEACEESGIHDFEFINILDFSSSFLGTDYHNILPFDLDIHVIPARKNEPEHYHFDVRFILCAAHENFQISSESLDLKWIDLNDVCQYTSEESTLRQVYKFKYLQSKTK